jgi:hypothetical protein
MKRRDRTFETPQAGGRKLRYIGIQRNQLWAELTSASYNLVRMANLCPVPA